MQMGALSTLRGIGCFLVREFTRDSRLGFAAAFPVMLPGIYLGDWLHVRITEGAFNQLVCVALVLFGIVLLWK